MRLKGGAKRPDREISPVHSNTSPDSNFASKISEFNDYYRVNCYSDIAEGLNQTWRCIDSGGVTIGHISVATAHLRPTRDPAFQGMGYGNIPALLVGYLATDKDHERQGVASDLSAWAVDEALRMSRRAGCRIVMLNPIDDPRVRRFYRNLGFRYVPAQDGEEDVFYFDIQEKITADTRPLPGNADGP